MLIYLAGSVWIWNCRRPELAQHPPPSTTPKRNKTIAGAAACSLTAPVQQQHFDLKFLSGPTLSTRPVRQTRSTTTARTYCFTVTNNATRGPDSETCDQTASPCCNPALIKLGRVFMRTSE